MLTTLKAASVEFGPKCVGEQYLRRQGFSQKVAFSPSALMSLRNDILVPLIPLTLIHSPKHPKTSGFPRCTDGRRATERVGISSLVDGDVPIEKVQRRLAKASPPAESSRSMIETNLSRIIPG